MINLTNSRSLTDFQRNARTLIDDINRNQEPLLLTVNGAVQAVLVDPRTFQEMDAEFEKKRFIEAIREGERDIREGRTQSIDEVIAELTADDDF